MPTPSPAVFHPAPPVITEIHNVRPFGGEPVHIQLKDGVIASITPVNSAGAAAQMASARTTATTNPTVVDGEGALLIPSFADVHVHLDSTRLGLPFRPHTGRPGVWGMMLNDRENWRNAEASITERVAITARMMLERGTTHMRAYGQVDVDAKLERMDAVLAVRETLRPYTNIQVVAWPQAGLLREAGSIDLIDQALSAGADVVGGLDPCAVDRDPARHLDAVFRLAEKHGAPIDIHLHERGTLGVFTLELICERTRAHGMKGQVTIAHAFALGTNDAATRAPLIEQFADLDIAITTVAPSGSGVLPLRELREAGVRVGLGEDGQRDYWSPYGNADMLDRTWQLAFTQGFRADRDIEGCLEVATLGGRSVADGIRRSPVLSSGDPADFLLMGGETLTSAVMDRPRERTVIHGGRLVHRGVPNIYDPLHDPQRVRF